MRCSNSGERANTGRRGQGGAGYHAKCPACNRLIRVTASRPAKFVTHDTTAAAAVPAGGAP